VRQLFLVHGVERALLGLKDLFMQQGFKDIAIPRNGEHFVI
jgi:hypothetical protein